MSSTGAHPNKILSMPSRLRGRGAASEAGETPVSGVRSIEVHRSEGSSAVAPVINIDALYTEIEALPATVVESLSALGEAIKTVDFARRSAEEEDLLMADDHITRFRLMLPRLFAARDVSRGYEAVINALYFSFVNKTDAALDLKQIVVVWRILKQLREHLFLSFDAAMEYVDELEASGFSVYPTSIGHLADLSNE